MSLQLRGIRSLEQFVAALIGFLDSVLAAQLAEPKPRASFSLGAGEVRRSCLRSELVRGVAAER
jgi:hypothetical protein